MTSLDENFFGSFETLFDHGLLIIEDGESGATHDGWDAASEYVHFDESSIYVAVQSVVDGPVSVVVYENLIPETASEGLIQAFSGEIESTSGRLKIHDSDDTAMLTVRGRAGTRRLVVLVDELNWTKRVVVLVDAEDNPVRL